MNYYNPYFYSPSAVGSSSPGFLRSLLGGSSINWSSILSNTQKVIGIANQAIPVVKQVSPVMKNAKTMFRVMNEFKKVDSPSTIQNSEGNNYQTTENKTAENIASISKEENIVSDGGPKFFI